MANFKFEIYQNNTLSFDVSIYGITDVSGFIPYFTVKKKMSDVSTVISSIGIIKDPSGTARFFVPASDTSLASGDYVFDITIEKDSSIFTINKDSLSVLDGVRY